jgi:hypothetical protein
VDDLVAYVVEKYRIDGTMSISWLATRTAHQDPDQARIAARDKTRVVTG